MALSLDSMNRCDVDWTLVSPWMTNCGGTPFVTFFNFTANKTKFLAKFTYIEYPNSDETRIDLFEDCDVPNTDEIVDLAALESASGDKNVGHFKKTLEDSLNHSGMISTCNSIISAVTPKDPPIMTGISEFNKPFLWTVEVEVNGESNAKKPMDDMKMIPVARCATQATIEVIQNKQEKEAEHSCVFKRMDAARIVEVLSSALLQVNVKHGKIM
jgi:hypothetical protein